MVDVAQGTHWPPNPRGHSQRAGWFLPWLADIRLCSDGGWGRHYWRGQVPHSDIFQVREGLVTTVSYENPKTRDIARLTVGIRVYVFKSLTISFHIHTVTRYTPDLS